MNGSPAAKNCFAHRHEPVRLCLKAREPEVPAKTAVNPKNLEALGAARLAELLVEITAVDAAAKRRLRLELAAAKSPGDLAKGVRNGLTTIARSRSLVSALLGRLLSWEY